MKVLLVTSDITYVPNNYYQLFETVLKEAHAEIWGLLILKNINKGLIKSALGLGPVLGAWRLQKTLLANIIKSPLQKRENLFKHYGKVVFSAETINSPQIVEWVKIQKIDLIINLRTRYIYKKPILEATSLGCLNIHHGLLPEYRGTMCDLYALSEGRDAGFTLHRMNEKIDDGEILIREVVEKGGLSNQDSQNGSMSQERNYLHYLEKSSVREGEVLAKFLKMVAMKGELPHGSSNKTENKIYTKNPTKETAKQLVQKGMIL